MINGYMERFSYGKLVHIKIQVLEISFFLSKTIEIIQLQTYAYVWLLNKPYKNKVTLR